MVKVQAQQGSGSKHVCEKIRRWRKINREGVKVGWRVTHFRSRDFVAEGSRIKEPFARDVSVFAVFSCDGLTNFYSWLLAIDLVVVVFRCLFD